MYMIALCLIERCGDELVSLLLLSIFERGLEELAEGVGVGIGARAEKAGFLRSLVTLGTFAVDLVKRWCQKSELSRIIRNILSSQISQ